MAAATMIATFALNRKITMRGFAIAANVLFIAYGILANLPPILALHLVLLPINVVKFIKMKNRQFVIKPKKKIKPIDVDGV